MTKSRMDFVLDHPIPGESLTADPKKRLPFERPPEYTDQKKAIDAIWAQLTDERTINKLYSLLRKDVPVADIAQVILFTGFAEGKWTPDLQLLLLEPTILMIMHLAYSAGISFVYSREIPDINELLEQKKNPVAKQTLERNNPEGLMRMENEDA